MALIDTIKENYPGLAPLMRNKEIANLLTLAVNESWSPGKFQSKFIASGWFRRQSETERRLWLLRYTDPGEYAQQLGQYTRKLAQVSYGYGARFPEWRLRMMARYGLAHGLDPNDPEILRQIDVLVKKYPQLAGYGARRTTARGLQAIARRDYLYGMSKKNAAEWASKVARGVLTEDDVRVALASRAARLYPWAKESLAAGQTMADLTDGHRQVIANELELDPESIDLSKGRWSRVLQAKQKDGTTRPMTMHEVMREARRDDRWGRTAGGREMQYALIRKLGTQFGARSFTL